MKVKNYHYVLNSALTVEKCSKICKGKQFKFYGVEVSTVIVFNFVASTPIQEEI